MLLAVVEHGSFAAAAERLLKSQSTVSYAMARLQEQLQVKVFEQKGRKAELTEAGQMVVRRATACWRTLSRWNRRPRYWPPVGSRRFASWWMQLSLRRCLWRR